MYGDMFRGLGTLIYFGLFGMIMALLMVLYAAWWLIMHIRIV